MGAHAFGERQAADAGCRREVWLSHHGTHGGAAVALGHVWRTKGAGHRLIEGKSPLLRAALLVTRPACFFSTPLYRDPFMRHARSQLFFCAYRQCKPLQVFVQDGTWPGHEIPIHVLAGTLVNLCKDCKHLSLVFQMCIGRRRSAWFRALASRFELGSMSPLHKK